MSWLELDVTHRFDSGVELRAQWSCTEPVVALMGPSGVGKTTLLSMIAGFVTPHSGTITVAGQRVCDTRQRLHLLPEQRQVGVVFQDYLLFPHLTVKGNLLFGPRSRKNPKIALDRVVEMLQIGPLLERRVTQLSGGERQRVALGRALLSQPRVLLLDEPLAALDDALRDQIVRDLAAIQQEFALPMLFVSHDLPTVRQFARQTITLQRGVPSLVKGA